MNRKMAFTLLETISVVTIVAVLIAITSPVLMRTMKSFKEIKATSNLRQIYIATDLYRTDHDGQALYGSAAIMGLPDYRVIYFTNGSLSNVLPGTNGLWSSPCGQHPDTPQLTETPTNLNWHPITGEGELWTDYVNDRQEGAVFLTDENCNDTAISLQAGYFTKKHIGVTLSGSIRRDISSGSESGIFYWSEH